MLKDNTINNMDRRNKILINGNNWYYLIVLFFIQLQSCGNSEMQYDKTYIKCCWRCTYQSDITLILNDDSTFIANNIPDVKVFLGRDSTMNNDDYYYFEKYQMRGVSGRWELSTETPEIILEYYSSPQNIHKKRVFIEKDNLFDGYRLVIPYDSINEEMSLDYEPTWLFETERILYNL